MAALVSAFMLGGCSSQSFATKSMREATQAPEEFKPKSGANLSETACISPLVDPADGTEILMVESGKGIGDYQAPAGKYGLKANELLRIDCQTGKVLGIVKK